MRGLRVGVRGSRSVENTECEKHGVALVWKAWGLVENSTGYGGKHEVWSYLAYGG